MLLSRRAVLVAGLTAFAMPASARPVDLAYEAGRLSWPGGETRAACGRGGVRPDKREGDGASPEGTFPLLHCYYRPDRLPAAPQTALPLTALQPNHGWVDDPADPNYNRLVTLPYPAHHEEMWRADGLYDLVILIGYNTDPPAPGRGSAIFLHIARPDFGPTEGCIAVGREAALSLLPLLGPESRITIRA
jgi:L,D-peptidoglycan transpeptidase YkuD (ErfK/YbiS/YcfS/YnhG family)